MNTAEFLLKLSASEYAQCIAHRPSNPELTELWQIVIDWASIHYPSTTLVQ